MNMCIMRAAYQAFEGRKDCGLGTREKKMKKEPFDKPTWKLLGQGIEYGDVWLSLSDLDRETLLRIVRWLNRESVTIEVLDGLWRAWWPKLVVSFHGVSYASFICELITFNSIYDYGIYQALT